MHMFVTGHFISMISGIIMLVHIYNWPILEHMQQTYMYPPMVADTQVFLNMCTASCEQFHLL